VALLANGLCVDKVDSIDPVLAVLCIACCDRLGYSVSCCLGGIFFFSEECTLCAGLVLSVTFCENMLRYRNQS
jgi:hypothetical protein